MKRMMEKENGLEAAQTIAFHGNARWLLFAA
jgi:hypothetical protein